MRKNEYKFIIQNITYTIALMLISGSVIQAFLLENGISETKVALYLSVIQIVQVGGMLALSVVIDRVKKVLSLCAFSTVFQLIIYAALIFLCVFRNFSVNTKYLLIFIASIIANIFQSIYNVVSYKLPYHAIKISRFGFLTGLLGVFTGIVCSAVTAVMTYFTKRFDYNTVMLVFFVTGALSFVVAFFSTISIEDIKPQIPSQQKTKVNLFKYKPFTSLIIPNLLRGFCTGILSVSMTVGFSLGITDKSSGATLTLLLQVSVVVSCIIYTWLARKNIDGWIVAVSSVLLFATMPLMFLGSLTMFYVVFFIANFFINFVNNAVPVAITKFVDYEYIGAYSSWRMLIHTLGIALSNSLLTPLLSLVGATALFVIAGSMQLVSGISYFICLKKNKIEL